MFSPDFGKRLSKLNMIGDHKISVDNRLLGGYLGESNNLGGTYVYDAIQFFLQKIIYWVWRKKGIGTTPHCVKEKVLLRYASLFKIYTLVETETFLGDMIKAVKRHFQTIYSIELDEQLYQRAKIRFGKIKHIHFLQGDSAQVLPEVLSLIREPSLFWLDAHYSGGITAKGCLETPIVQELRLIRLHPLATKHVILIDDARNFVGANDYPTLQQVDNIISMICPSLMMEVKEDIIRIYQLAWISTETILLRLERFESLARRKTQR